MCKEGGQRSLYQADLTARGTDVVTCGKRVHFGWLCCIAVKLGTRLVLHQDHQPTRKTFESNCPIMAVNDV